jgi:hypothetical protein
LQPFGEEHQLILYKTFFLAENKLKKLAILPNDPFIVFGCDACQVMNHNVFPHYWMKFVACTYKEFFE